MRDKNLIFGRVYYAGYTRKYNIPVLIDINVDANYIDKWCYIFVLNDHIIDVTLGHCTEFISFYSLYIYFSSRDKFSCIFKLKKEVVNTQLKFIRFRRLDVEGYDFFNIEKSDIQQTSILFKNMKKEGRHTNACRVVSEMMQQRNNKLINRL